MYGKIFESMYDGSMYGAGCSVFAVWGYVIAKMRPDKEVGAQVDLNPVKLKDTLGATQEEIERAIKRLCAPDLHSRSKEEEGRRLIKLGEFAYRVVNGSKYMKIRNEEERRESDRDRKRRQRSTKKEGGDHQAERNKFTDGKNLDNPGWVNE